jgi:hypothetical protein
MAGDWVKMRSALLANPKVHAIAKAVGRDQRASAVLTTGHSGAPDQVLSRHALRHVTVTALLCVWSSANEHSDAGTMACCGLDDLDEIAGIPGFGEAMQAVGWAVGNEAKNCVLLPNFSEHNTPARDRTAAERQRRRRAKCHGVTVTRDTTVTVTQRREEKINPPPPHHEAAQDGQAAAAKVRGAWDALVRSGHGQAYRANAMPDGFADRLAEPGWLDEALAAIEHLPKCRWFKTPATLIQLCRKGFATKVLAGQYDQPAPVRGHATRPTDGPPPLRGFEGEDLARFEAARARELAKCLKVPE